jgi:hypothetical protein
MSEPSKTAKAPGTSGEQTSLFVNLVNPKFNKFDKPICLAVTVGGLTVVLTAWLTLTFAADCNTIPISIFGAEHVQDETIGENRVALKKGSKRENFCLSYMKAFSVDVSGDGKHFHHKWDNQEYVSNIRPVDCLPNEGWLKHGGYEWNEFLDDTRKPRDPIPICDVSSPHLAEEHCWKNKNGECFNCFDDNDPVNPVFAVYKKTTCTSLREALGLALAYTAYIESFFTVVLVLVCFKGGIIQMKEGEKFKGVLDVLDEEGIKEKEDKLQAKLTAMQHKLDELERGMPSASKQS